MSTSKNVRADLFSHFTEFQTIPLHRYNDSRTEKSKKTGKTKTRQLGKSPLDKSWTTRFYRTPKVIERCIKENRNMGVRLRTSELVIDVDPRNGGDEGFANLCHDVGLDVHAYPTVVTGSGGLHLYGKKPADLPIVDTLKNYPGVEFKSKNRQVLAAGCVHPNGKLYLFHEDRPSLEDGLPDFPKGLYRMIARPQHSILKGGGQYGIEELATALDALEPEDFKSHDEWLQLMMACHHATNGDGRDIFVEWSARDPDFADDSEQVGRRWDSLSTEGDGSKVTYKTLNMLLSKAGHADLAVTTGEEAQDDFAFEDIEDYGDEDDAPPKPKAKKRADDDFEGPAEDDFEGGAFDDSEQDEDAWMEGGHTKQGRKSELQKLNEDYVAVLDGSKFRIVKKEWDETVNRWRWLRIAKPDFEATYSNQRVLNPHDPDKTMPLGKAWIEWPGRNTVSQVVFAPMREIDGALNLWTDWSVKPNRNGEWTYLQEMLFECMCNGVQEHYDYLIKWAADMIQNPAQPAETAVVVRGGEGIGKGTWGNTLAFLCGQHGMAISSPDLLVGRFNSHLQDLIFLFADEAIRPYDRAGEAKLRAIITERTLSIEGKGRDTVTCPNYLHVFMASNEKWVVPAAMDARRFFVLEANDKWKHDGERWSKLYTQLRQNGNSGYGALLQYLQNVDLEGFSTSHSMPKTDALTDQKLASLPLLHRFFHEALRSGELPFDVTGDWQQGPIEFFQVDFRDAYQAYAQSNHVRYANQERSDSYFLIRDTSELFPAAQVGRWRKVPDDRPELSRRADRRAQVIRLPSQTECRSAFCHAIRAEIDWTHVGRAKQAWE